MEVLILTIFISIALIAGELLFFAWNVHTGNHDHVERLTLLPLDRDEAPENHAPHEEGSA